MAATAQDASAPLRGPEKKDEDRDEEGAASARSEILRECCARSGLLAMPNRRSYASHAILDARPTPLFPARRPCRAGPPHSTSLSRTRHAICPHVTACRACRGGVLALLRHREGRGAAGGPHVQRPRR